MANQEKTNREEDGKQEKLPQEGYGQKPVSKREMESLDSWVFGIDKKGGQL